MQRQSDLIGRAYARPEDIVTQPDKWVACSQYFIRRWVPDLGGNAVLLILFLRNYGYYNPATGECRDEIRGLSESRIAQGIGCSVSTLRRLIADHPYIGYFVRVQSDYESTPNGCQAQTTNIYWIAMYDPIHPEDAALLEEAKQIFAEQNKIRPPFKMTGGGMQNDRGARVKMNTPPGQNDRANIMNLYSESLLDSLPIINHHGDEAKSPNSAKTLLDDDDEKSLPKEDSFDAHQHKAYEALLRIQIAPATAKKLAMKCPPDQILSQIEIDSYRPLPANGSQGRLISILEGRSSFPTPKGYLEAQARQQRKIAEQKERQITEQQRAKEEAEHRELEQLYEGLEVDEKALVETEALAMLSPVLRQRPESHAAQSQLVLRRREVLLKRFGKHSCQGGGGEALWE